MKAERNPKESKKETSTKVSLEEKASEWMEMQESSPRPGSTLGKQYIPKGVTLNPIVKMVSPLSLRPNPNNDFDPLSEEEYKNLKENIAQNGILDALTAKKDGMLVTGENRYKIALELQEHEDESVRRRVESIPVRYYMNELTLEEEYDILEGDNLFRRHLTAEQRKERLKKRILRKYKDELVLDNRGGDRKSESSKTSEETKPESEFNSEMLSEGFKETESNYQDDSLIGHSGKDLVNNESSLVGSGSEKSKDEGHPLIGNSSKNLAKKVSENENIPLGTAKNYISELKKELKSKEPKVVSEKEKKKGKNESKSKTLQSKDKVKEFQKKYSKMSSTAKKAEVNRLIGKLIQVRKNREKLDAQVTAFIKEDSLIVEKLFAVGEKKRVQGLSV
ncbi:chromosome partitioning protein ParB [Leptospira noguchii]|uniref:Chromosome partitioning protein ParB n=1 Tax=Leptospira noguchii TaxID=28182 RepID=A0AAE9GGM7_9LEPT|nr:chromosome partitioning protein ParB [Leptospira noguchii]UOG55019.1 chromosome partitioning protein ParB [Leptospira noguchii]UOG58835.1 chromosome partitioning protein ParB [Leptospira noguchii]UOG58863.1 chromosome partitioning protein ParB [Leptospira noguchii]